MTTSSGSAGNEEGRISRAMAAVANFRRIELARRRRPFAHQFVVNVAASMHPRILRAVSLASTAGRALRSVEPPQTEGKHDDCGNDAKSRGLQRALCRRTALGSAFLGSTVCPAVPTW